MNKLIQPCSVCLIVCFCFWMEDSISNFGPIKVHPQLIIVNNAQKSFFEEIVRIECPGIFHVP